VSTLENTKPIAPPANPEPPNPGTEEVFVLPASLVQERLWALDRMNPGNPTWSVPVRFRLQGPLDPALLERAFNQIIQRHEVLRTTFTVVDGQPAQVIKSSLHIEVPVVDLRHFPKPERDAEVDRLSFNEARWRFDLAVGPLFRVTLLRVEDNEHVMLVTPHHSVIDYLSIGLISNELGALCEAYSRNVEPVLPELTIQYGDYAVWQREQSESPAVQKELAYWKEQLKDLPLLDVPTDRPRRPSPTFEATITSLLLPVTLTDAVREIGNRESATFFNTMLAALGVLMVQYTGQTDFGAATQVAGRNSVELESVIGPFINTVVLRLDLSGNPTFPQLLQRVQEVGLQSIANQNVRYEQVLKELRPNDYPSHHTLFRLNFICQRDPVKAQEFAGIKLTVIPSKSQGALYDLHVFLVLRNEGWRLACEYNTDLFEAGTITRLLADFKGLLESIVQDPNRPLSQFPVSEAAAKRRQMRPANNSTNSAGNRQRGVGVPRSLGAAAAAAEAAADKQKAAGQESYAMPASVAQQRFYAMDELSPGNPGSHVFACVRLNGQISLSWLERSFAALAERHESLRTTFQKQDGELLQVIHPATTLPLTVTALEAIAEPELEKKLWDELRAEGIVPFDLAKGPLLRARLFRLAEQEHVLMLTTHHIVTDGWSQSVIQRELWTVYEALIQGSEARLPALPIQYGDYAHWQAECIRSEAYAQDLAFWEKELSLPVPVLEMPTDRPPRNRPATHAGLETLLLPAELTAALKQVSQLHGATMFMTTLSCFAALLCCYAEQEEIIVGSLVANRKAETEGLLGLFANPIMLRLGLSGNPTLAELLDRVRDKTVDALNHADMPFEVLVDHLKVPSVHGRNPLSQCSFSYRVAFLRSRELPGLKVSPLPDMTLGTHFELQLGMLEWSEGLRAQLEYNPDLYDATTIRKVLADYQRVLELLRDRPEVRVGDLEVAKIGSKTRTRQPDGVVNRLNRPADETETRLRKIWEDLLGVSPIGLSQNYFELGGSSVMAAGLFARIEKEFQRRLPLTKLYEAPTIAELAALLRDDVASAEWSPLVTIQAKGSRPPLFLVHGGGGNVLIYSRLAKYLGTDQPVYGLQSRGLDGKGPLLKTIEEMASLYVQGIRGFQAHGPYYLGGYCLGGTVAYEMAQQLRAQGEEVALLALLDTANWCAIPKSTPWIKMRWKIERIMFHVKNFLLLNAPEKAEFFREKWGSLQSRSEIWKGKLFGRFLQNAPGVKDESLVLAEIWDIHHRASSEYHPRPYEGVITDFQPMRQYSEYLATDSSWEPLAQGEHEIVTLPVYPAGMLMEPFVKHLADALKTAISRTTR
jgi:non-ribosomal peptide synthetase component F/thioesterase domain-containing protein